MVVHLDSIICMLVETKWAKSQLGKQWNWDEMDIWKEIKTNGLHHTKKQSGVAIAKSQERDMKGMRTQRPYN